MWHTSGGVCSARAFTNPVDELLEQQHSCPGCHPIAFADDNNVTIIGIDPTTMVDMIQICIDKSIAWGKANGLIFGPEKKPLLSGSYQATKRTLKTLREST